MTESEAFMRAIIDSPGDDSPRLIFADWLEENGQEQWGEFLRVQCALAADMAAVAQRGDSFPAPPKPPGFLLASRRKALRQRERYLLADLVLLRWPAALLPRFAYDLHPQVAANEVYCGDWTFRFERGLIASVRTTAAGWQEHGALVLAAQPVTEVILAGDPVRHIADACMSRLVRGERPAAVFLAETLARAAGHLRAARRRDGATEAMTHRVEAARPDA